MTPVQTARGFKLNGDPVIDPALSGYGVSELFYQGYQLTESISDLVTDITFERSMEEPSSLTVTFHDPGRLLQTAGTLDEAVNIDVGDQTYRLRSVSKSGDDFTATFEDRDVAKLRGNGKAKKASRGKVTRSQFVRSCVIETPGITFWDPEMDLKQKTAAPEDTPGVTTKITPAGSGTSKSAGAASRAPGFASGASLRGAQGALGPDQVRNLALCLSIAKSLNASPKATLAMVEAGLVEAPDFKNSSVASDATSTGVFQLLTSTAAGLGISPTDVTACCRAFFLKGFYGKGGAIALAKTDRSAGIVAADVEGPRADLRGRYDAVRDVAVKLIEAYTGDASFADDSSSAQTTTVSVKAYEFTRGTDQGPESTWTMAKRLAEEVQKRCFVVDHEFIFAFDRDLMQSKPAATISELDDGVDYIDYEYNAGKRIETCSVACRAEAWAARPGDVVVVDGNGRSEGRWLVSRISGSLFTLDRTIELTRPMKALPEPAPETTTSSSTQTLGGSDVAGDTLRAKIISVAESSLSTKTGYNRYSQPGALTQNPTPAPPARTDCSQWIRACYLQAGAQDPGTNTYDMVAKGTRTKSPKPGDILITANQGHCELYVGGGRTIGHGTAPIDYATVGAFPGCFFLTYPGLSNKLKTGP